MILYFFYKKMKFMVHCPKACPSTIYIYIIYYDLNALSIVLVQYGRTSTRNVSSSVKHIYIKILNLNQSIKQIFCLRSNYWRITWNKETCLPLYMHRQKLVQVFMATHSILANSIFSHRGPVRAKNE